jgi:hypothetical protein
MPFDGCSPREPWREPWQRQCRSCMRPITAYDAVEVVQLDHGGLHSLHHVGGTYHAACARPILSLLRALETVRSLAR